MYGGSSSFGLQKSKIVTEGLEYINDSITFSLLRPEASVPIKNNPSSVCWDLSIVARDENREEDSTNKVNVFRTGIGLVPPKGYHFEIVSKPILAEQGYMLPGTVVIDPDDNDEITVPLVKFSNSEDLELPCSFLQLVLRETNYCTFVQKMTKEVAQKQKLSTIKQKKHSTITTQKKKKGNNFF
jgi:hypothetical protein